MKKMHKLTHFFKQLMFYIIRKISISCAKFVILLNFKDYYYHIINIFITVAFNTSIKTAGILQSKIFIKVISFEANLFYF